ncbi:hypothetical protein J6590_027727 [Homalodisca vitripennis]|nr:hypothetical protein J6590_027727 [Homalodisca vitripennis]
MFAYSETLRYFRVCITKSAGVHTKQSFRDEVSNSQQACTRSRVLGTKLVTVSRRAHEVKFQGRTPAIAAARNWHRLAKINIKQIAGLNANRVLVCDDWRPFRGLDIAVTGQRRHEPRIFVLKIAVTVNLRLYC